MIKLTVRYNLPPGADHDEFLKGRNRGRVMNLEWFHDSRSESHMAVNVW